MTNFYFFLISKCDCLFLLREVFFYSLNVEAYTRSTVFSQRENRNFYSNSIFVSPWISKHDVSERSCLLMTGPDG